MFVFFRYHDWIDIAGWEFEFSATIPGEPEVPVAWLTFFSIASFAWYSGGFLVWVWFWVVVSVSSIAVLDVVARHCLDFVDCFLL